jgi:NAD(P)H-flavin reductase
MMALPGVAEREVPGGVAASVATVRRVFEDAYETYTYWVSLDDPVLRRRYRFEPGQINMIGLPGIGEIPISVSSDPARPRLLAHTIRACGRVTNAFKTLRRGDRVTIRGPFGHPWPVARARGGDLLIVAGGLGMAPVRPAAYTAIRNRGWFRRLIVLVGARGPEHVLYPYEMDMWAQWLRERGIELMRTVDVADASWPYDEGVVTTLFSKAHIDPRVTSVFTCGPEIMMRFAVRDLITLGVPQERIWLSMERNMQCGVKLCGHCQLGPYFVCADGPVFRYDQLEDLMGVEEL